MTTLTINSISLVRWLIGKKTRSSGERPQMTWVGANPSHFNRVNKHSPDEQKIKSPKNVSYLMMF